MTRSTKIGFVCVVPKDFKTEHPGYITIEELKKQHFVTQREGCDADVNNVMTKYGLPGGGGSYIVDDMSAISLVMGGYGVCLVPELVMRKMPFPVDIYPLEVKEERPLYWPMQEVMSLLLQSAECGSIFWNSLKGN